ncbi:hypothetical protein GGG16DRAFT_43846 [Schizophyllum commune]
MVTRDHPPLPHDFGHPRMQYWPSPLRRRQAAQYPWAQWTPWSASAYPYPSSLPATTAPLPPNTLPPQWTPYSAPAYPTPYRNVSIPMPGSAPLPCSALPPMNMRHPPPHHAHYPPWISPASAPPPPHDHLPHEEHEDGPEPVWPTNLPPGSVPSQVCPLPNMDEPTPWEPGVFPPVPVGTTVPIRLHPALLYNPVDLSLPPLQWDILHGPSSARLLTPRCLFVAPPLDEEAIAPPTNTLYIVGDSEELKWWMAKEENRWGPLVLSKPDGKITVREILDAIHTYFQQPLTKEQVAMIEEKEEVWGGKTRLRSARALRLEQSYIIEHNPTVYRRVDVVGGHRKFMGMRVQVYADDTWKILLGLMEGPSPRWTLDRKARW